MNARETWNVCFNQCVLSFICSFLGLQVTRSVHQGKLEVEHTQLIKEIQDSCTRERARIEAEAAAALAEVKPAKQ